MYTPLIDHDIPYAEFDPTFEDLEARVGAAMAAMADLGAVPEENPNAKAIAMRIFEGNKASDEELSDPSVVVEVNAILESYANQVVKSAVDLRHLVTNKLILLSDNRDPRIQLKALEMLGKISDVGLFTEKTEITLRHRPTEELEQLLRERLTKIVEGEVVDRTVPQRALEMDIEDITGRPTDGPATA